MARNSISTRFRPRSHDGIAYAFMLWNLRREGQDALATQESPSRDGYGSVVRMSYYEDTAFSYNTPVARIVRDIEDKLVLLVSRERHSLTTQTHVAKYQSACRSGPEFKGDWTNPVIPSITVPCIGVRGGWNGEDTQGLSEAHELNLCDMLTSIELQESEFINAYRSDWKVDTYCIASMTKQDEDMRMYCRRFGLSEPLLDPLDMRIRRVLAARQDRMTAWLDPKAVLRRERARVRRLMRQAFINE